jgi:hypothetical protein
MTPNLFDASVIDPDPRAGVVLVELLRGIAENGLLANLHKDRWLRHVLEQRIGSLPPGLKDRILTLLNRLHDRHRLVRHPRCQAGDPATDYDWLRLALESHERISFHGILLSQDLIDGCGQNCDAFIEFLGALDSPQWEARRGRTLTLNKSAADYRSALAPLVRHARVVQLVDPYLNSDEKRYFSTVDLCSELMGQRVQERLAGRIDIHALAKRQKPDGLTIQQYLDAWESKLRPLVARDHHRFRVHLWECPPGGESMHDRFILTDQCAVSVPGGLDCRSGSHPNSTDWTLLDEDARTRRWSDYDPATSPFQRVGYLEVA